MEDGSLDAVLRRDGFLPDRAVDAAWRSAAIDAFLLHGRVAVAAHWPRKRRVMAAKQLVCRNEGIEVGTIDGLYGPQTAWAFELRAVREHGGDAFIPGRDDPTPTTPRSTTSPWPREEDVETFYGPMGVNQVRLQLPFPMRIAWDTSKTVRSFLIHQRVHDSAARCFERIAQHYNEAQRRDTGIDQFGGCLNVRRKRGGRSWSMHSWGIAIDFDPARNPLRATHTTARLAQPDCHRFWEIWEEEGWTSLGRSRDFDWMHVEAVT